jgi:hypothetical protein
MIMDGVSMGEHVGVCGGIGWICVADEEGYEYASRTCSIGGDIASSLNTPPTLPTPTNS